MRILHSDQVIRVAPGTTPDYDQDNPLLKLMSWIEDQELGADLEFYVYNQLQYLFPIKALSFYGPSGGNADVLDPEQQDVKTDFQKQNVKDVIAADSRLLRGTVDVGGTRFPMLRVSYSGGPDSVLARQAGLLGDHIQLFIKVGSVQSALLRVPYNDRSDRFELELWGYAGGVPLTRAQVGEKAWAGMARGEILIRPDLVQGGGYDFAIENVTGRDVVQVAPAHALHPILPLHVEVAWGNADATVFDSRNGANYHYHFRMILRGWNNFLAVGSSSNPHGGVGGLEYRNLLSNYFGHQALDELGRTLEAWNYDAAGQKGAAGRRESFLAVDYMDLHVVRPNCGIGLHRHRDNQEIFLLMQGRAFMVVGDWCEFPDRDRAIEVRTLEAGHFAMLKGGNLHALMNPTDEDLSLFMFGGYD